MKKLHIFLFLLFIACSDGDLQIETLDFDSIGIQDCDDIAVNSTNVLFKIDGDETLILELQSGALTNGNSTTDTVTTERSIPSQARLIYRVFSGTVTSTYFCDDFPPAEPTVTEEIEAESGTVIVKSIANADSTAFSHTIQFTDIRLVQSGERITDLSINDFGEISTSITN